MRPHTAVKQKILKMLEIRKSMIYNLQWKVNGLRTFPFTASNDRIIARQSWILDSRYWIRNSLSEKLGFWIPIFSGIQVSLSWIPDSKAQDFGFRKQIFQDSGFHKQKFPLFHNPDSLARGDTYVYGLGRDGVVEVIVNSSGGSREGEGARCPPYF